MAERDLRRRSDEQFSHWSDWSIRSRLCIEFRNLGESVELLHKFHDFPQDFIIYSLTHGSFEKKLYAMYLSYLPKEATVFNYKMNVDDRGNFTELIRTLDYGQVSINISKLGITKGQHWNLFKW